VVNSITIKVPDLNKISVKIQQQTERALAREVEFAKGEILIRTNSGRDADEAPFKQYSPSYEAQRVDRGYSAQVNLTITGTLLTSITSKVQKTAEGFAGVLFFLAGRPDGGSNSEIALKHNTGDYGGKKLKPRRFFALSIKQIREIISNIRKEIKP